MQQHKQKFLVLLKIKDLFLLKSNQEENITYRYSFYVDLLFFRNFNFGFR